MGGLDKHARDLRRKFTLQAYRATFNETPASDVWFASISPAIPNNVNLSEDNLLDEESPDIKNNNSKPAIEADISPDSNKFELGIPEI